MSIKVNNVSYLYNKKENLDKAALKEISLTINDKDFVTIVGKTGSGKSTLVQTFNALILPTFGYNEIEEFFITEDKKLKKELLKNKDKTIRKENKRYSKLKKKVGMVFQFPEYQLFSETVLKDVMFGPKNFGFSEEEAKERAIKALKDVGIPESYFDKSPFELSGGEKRRVAIAGIIASECAKIPTEDRLEMVQSDKPLMTTAVFKVLDSQKIDEISKYLPTEIQEDFYSLFY